MTEAKDKKSKPEQARQAGPYPQCYCMEAREILSRLTQAFGLPEDATEHFRQARIEVLKGVRGLLDHRIETLSRVGRKGTRVTVE